ncbi:MAG: hypothetical protein JXA14_10570 [Anaerolineae bacterium]|jgi:hypothetical protein|nr:hypothetical protein [Anaerolineae bacterium]
MNGEAVEASLQATRRTLMIMWFGFLAEPLIYALLPWIVSAEQVGGSERGLEPYWKWGSYLLAVVLAAASALLRRFLLSDHQLEALRGGDASALIEASRRYLNASLLGWSLNSCIPISGVVLLFTGGDGMTILVLVAAAMVLNLLVYPQLDGFIERVRDLSHDGEEI